MYVYPRVVVVSLCLTLLIYIYIYPSIPHQDGLDALSIKLEQREDKKISTEDLLEMAQFVLKNNYFEFNSKVKQQE